VTEDGQFSTEVTHVGGATVIHVYGEIDIETCERLRDAIEPHMGPEQAIILDLSGVRFMDSSCLNVLVQARGRLTADGGSLLLRNPSDVAHRILSATHLDELLETNSSCADQRAQL
jgi:anti-anti-sigma factor